VHGRSLGLGYYFEALAPRNVARICALNQARLNGRLAKKRCSGSIPCRRNRDPDVRRI
jgi:hypothetical protein